MKELVKTVLDWWEEHQYDTGLYNDGDEYNIYDDEPEFVTMAKRLVASGLVKFESSK